MTAEMVCVCVRVSVNGHTLLLHGREVLNLINLANPKYVDIKSQPGYVAYLDQLTDDAHLVCLSQYAYSPLLHPLNIVQLAGTF